MSWERLSVRALATTIIFEIIIILLFLHPLPPSLGALARQSVPQNHRLGLRYRGKKKKKNWLQRFGKERTEAEVEEVRCVSVGESVPPGLTERCRGAPPPTTHTRGSEGRRHPVAHHIPRGVGPRDPDCRQLPPNLVLGWKLEEGASGSGRPGPLGERLEEAGEPGVLRGARASIAGLLRPPAPNLRGSSWSREPRSGGCGDVRGGQCVCVCV